MPAPLLPGTVESDSHAGVLPTLRGRVLPLPLPERKVLLFVGDTLAVIGALLVVTTWRLQVPPTWEAIGSHRTWFLLLLGLWGIVGSLLNAYDLQLAARIRTGMQRPLVAALVVGGLYLAIPYITPPLLSSRLTAGSFVLALVGLVAIGRMGYALLLAQPAFRQRILVVGAGWNGSTLVEAVRAHAPTVYDIIGYIDDDPTKRDAIIQGVPVLGTRRDLARIVRDQAISEVIIAITHYDTIEGELVQALMACHELGVQVTAMPVLFERLTGKVPVEHAGQGLHVILPTDGGPSLVYLAAKRVIDVSVGLLGGVVMLGLFPLVALAMRLESPGPIFYRQVRLGRGSRPFMLVKFRTMVPNAEVEGPQWAQDADPRMTKIGRILRRLHLDEVPQAINLLRGEMSFIGPRPERPEFVTDLEKRIPFYRTRHALRPGITGWAQVNYQYGSSTEDAFMKLQYDLYYVKRCSLWLDLLIFVKTLGLFLTFRGR